MIFFMLVSKTATTAEACLPTLSIPNDSRYSTKAFLIFSMRQSLNCTIHHYLFEEKHMYKDPLNSKKQMKIPIVSILQENQFSTEQTKFETCMWRTSRQKG